MTDYPPGKWSPLFVAHVWPSGSDLHIIRNESMTNFRNLATIYHRFENELQQNRFELLSSQEGITVGDLRYAFQQGEKHAREIAEKNETKGSAYDFSYDSACELRSELTAITEKGNSNIKQIENSKDPPAIKIDKIVAVVLNCQTEATTKAAVYGDNIFNATQQILNKEGIAVSARQFAQDHGIDTETMFRSPTKETVREHVEKLLSQPKTPLNGNPPVPDNSPYGYGAVIQQPVAPSATATTQSSTATADGATYAGTIQQPNSASVTVTGASTQMKSPAGSSYGSAIQQPRVLPAGPPPTPLVGEPPVPPPAATLPPVPTPNQPSAPTVSSLPPMSPSGPFSELTPSGLMQSFDHGLQTGAPMPAMTNALSNGSMGAMESHLQLQPPPVIPEASIGSTIPATAHAPVFDVPQQAHPPVTATAPSINTPASGAGIAYVATPTGTASPVPISPPPSGSLPAYGADLRLPTSAASAPTTPPSPPAAAPVNPSAASGMGQPAVIRQPAEPTVSQQTSAGVVERAVVASASSAAAGGAFAKVTAQSRLQRLIDAAARQEPRLRWAAGDRPDNTTVFVTDLASGWIPPGIDIPVGVQLRDPAHRRGDIKALLGEVITTASYTPIHYVPPSEDDEPFPTSLRARQVPIVDDLGWKLGQATKWRDGLPQLVHTLAKAASRGTGVLDTEIKFLREELVKAREQVLNSYPNSVKPAAVANWQLLATISALAENDKTGAHYHFAWFQALNQAGGRERMS